MLPQEPSSFRPEPCQSSLSLSEQLLNSLCLLLLAIACAFPIALETGVVQAGEARDVDFINSTLYCPFTLRGLAQKGGEGDLGTSLFAPPCSRPCPVPQCQPTFLKSFFKASTRHAPGREECCGPFHGFGKTMLRLQKEQEEVQQERAD